MMDLEKIVLYREDGGSAGFYDVCQWIIDHYPPDIFVDENPELVAFRDWCIDKLEERSSDEIEKQMVKQGEV